MGLLRTSRSIGVVEFGLYGVKGDGRDHGVRRSLGLLLWSAAVPRRWSTRLQRSGDDIHSRQSHLVPGRIIHAFLNRPYKCGFYGGELLTLEQLLYSSATCLFNKMQHPTHCIHNLLPSVKALEYSLRNSQAYMLYLSASMSFIRCLLLIGVCFICNFLLLCLHLRTFVAFIQ